MPPVKIDIVLQSSGIHAWNVCQGYLNALLELGILHRVFRPRSTWNVGEPEFDDGLFKYLAAPEADLMLLLGFDWHSQPMHSSPSWQQAWRESKIKKVLLALESVIDQDATFGDQVSSRLLRRAGSFCDCIVVSVEQDLALAQPIAPSSFYQPYGVDHLIFRDTNPFLERENKGYFRGKTTAYFTEKTYSARRECLELLKRQGLTEVVPFRDIPLKPQDLVGEYNKFRIALNLPAVTMSGHPARVMEAMACGACLITFRTNGTNANALFKDGEDLFYYDPADPQTLVAALEKCVKHPEQTLEVAAQGKRTVLSHHTLTERIKEILKVNGFEPVYPGRSRTMLYFRVDAIGDNVLSSGLLEPLKARYPELAINVVCQDTVRELYRHCPFVQRIVSFNEAELVSNERYQGYLYDELSCVNGEIALNPVYSRTTHADRLCLASQATRRVTLEGDTLNSDAVEHHHLLSRYTEVIGSEFSYLPELERNRQFAVALGLHCDSLAPQLWISKEDEEFADRFFSRESLRSDTTVAVAAGSKDLNKIYPHFDRVLKDIHGADFLLLGGKDDLGLTNCLQRSLGQSARNLAGKLTLGQTAAFIKRSHLLLGSDSACAHLAAATACPHVIVLGGGHFGRFLPYSKYCTVVCLPLPCYGCNWSCLYDFWHCINSIDPGIVLQAIAITLSQGSDRPRICLQASGTDSLRPLHPDWRLDLSLRSRCKIIEIEDIADFTADLTGNTSAAQSLEGRSI